MNILSINPFKITNSAVSGMNSYNTQPRFGIVMQKPLHADTISFGDAKAQSKKSMEKGAYAISEELAMKIQAMKAIPHERKKQLLERYFGDLMESGVISFYERIKGLRSIREKATTYKWATQKQVLQHMEDISGFCFVLNNPKAFGEVIKRIDEMLKSRDIEVKQGEYHRRPAKYKKNQIVKSYESLKPNDLQKLKATINTIQNPTTQIWFDVDSRSGYSGLHLILRTKDDEKAELQIMTYSMSMVKKVENILYKIRNGKSIDKRYEFISRYLTKIKPLRDDATEEEKKAHNILQTALTKYVQEAYYMPLLRPFDPHFKPLSVNEAETLSKKEKKLIAAYDLNILADLMARADYLDEKLGSAGMDTLRKAIDKVPEKGNSTEILFYLDIFERIIDSLGIDALTDIMETCEKISGNCDYKTIEILVTSYENIVNHPKR